MDGNLDSRRTPTFPTLGSVRNDLRVIRNRHGERTLYYNFGTLCRPNNSRELTDGAWLILIRDSELYCEPVELVWL